MPYRPWIAVGYDAPHSANGVMQPSLIYTIQTPSTKVESTGFVYAEERGVVFQQILIALYAEEMKSVLPCTSGKTSHACLPDITGSSTQLQPAEINGTRGEN
jgi:hypothetical protein